MTRITTHPQRSAAGGIHDPAGLSANALSRALDVPPNRKERAVTTDTALVGTVFRHLA
jgi:hypothetical protein